MTPWINSGETGRVIGALDLNAALCYYAALPVADIQSFSAQGSAHNVNLSFEIQGGANPNDYATVYVSDNPAGPARLIGLLTDHAALAPAVNNWVDSYRLPPSGNYYYWLDFGPFHGSDVLLSPETLFAALLPATVSGSSFSPFDAPEIYFVHDAAYDLGGRIEIAWYSSSDYEYIDHYNIYRNTYPPGHPEHGAWKYIASVDPEVAYYLDESAVTNWPAQYKVSAAHHGSYALQPDRGNEGIWNEMSNIVSASAVNNFWNDQITLTSDDTLRVCPAGDDGSLQTEVVIWGSNIAPTVAIPAHMIECHPANETAVFCEGTPFLILDEPTDEFGRSTVSTSNIGGRGRTDLIYKLFNTEWRFDTLTVYLKSPDFSGNGIVNVADFSAFAASYTSPPKPYLWYLDFAAPFGTITLPDFAYLSSHNNHQCGGSGLIAGESLGTSNAAIEINLAEIVSASGRLLYADIYANDLTSFKAALFNLRTDNPMLEYESWEGGSFPGRVLATPVVRDGIKEFAIGVLDGDDYTSRTTSLGRIVYRINGNEDLALTLRDFETRAADVLSKDGSVLRASGSKGEVTSPLPRIISDALAQNRPNPFNPTTTLSYSVSKPSRVTLRVFAVDGSLVRTLVDLQQNAGIDTTLHGTVPTMVVLELQAGFISTLFKHPTFQRQRKWFS